MKAMIQRLCTWRNAVVVALRWFLAGGILTLVASCGGGAPAEETASPRLLATTQVTTESSLSVTSIEKISENRVGRTTFDYAFKVTVKNSGLAQAGVRVIVKSVGQGAQIIGGDIAVGSVPAGASVTPNGLIVIRQDRAFPFDRAGVKFDVTSTGPEDPPGGIRKAEATLQEGVRVLTPVELQRITAITETSVAFSQDLALLPGTIFIAQETAYKSVASTANNGVVVVTVTAPAVEEIFQRLEIRGKFEVGESQADRISAGSPSSKNGAMVTPMATGAATITDTVPFSIGPVSGKSTMTGTLTVEADYLFDKSLGGLQSATLTATTDIENTIDLQMKAREKLFEYPIKGRSYYIPIRLSIYDALLNAVGVQTAGIFIPVGAVLTASAEFNASAQVKSGMRGTATAAYDKGVSSSSFIPTANTSVAVSDVAVTATIEQKIDSGIYLNLRPALSALNTVALAGVDLRLGPRVQLNSRKTTGTPPYCLNVEAFVHAEASFFFKTIGVSLTTSPSTFDKSVFTDPLLGTCVAPTTIQITAITAPSAPPVFGELIDVDVLVRPVPEHAISGKPPSGIVTIRSGTQSCKTVIQVDGTGRCALSAEQAGVNTIFDATYAGDKVYESSTISTLVTIEKSRSLTTLAATPSSVTVNNTVTFTSVLSPLPDKVQKLPSGTVNMITSTGAILCSATLSGAGTAACTAPMPNVGIANVTAYYTGDINYLTSSSSPVAITVNAAAGLASATLMVPDLQSNWSGLPASIQFTSLSIVNKTSFQISGNSATCGTGERGGPIFSAAVPAGAVFYAAGTTTGVPYTASGPGVNRRNCSSFVAVMMVPDPSNPAQTKPRIWMNGTGRGQRFTGGGPTLDWESQVRFDSGDPWTGTGRSCVGGTVANSGFFGANWTSDNCSATLTY